MSKPVSILLIFAFVVSACSSMAGADPTLALTTDTPVVPATLAPTLTSAPTLAPTETVPPSPTPFTPFNATVWVDNVNVRVNPGYLFTATKVIKMGSNVRVMGRCPGGEWIYVEIPDGTKGWIFAELILTEQNLQALPIVEPQDVKLIKGHVADSQGVPISGIGFGLVQGSVKNVPSNTVSTDANGDFYSFMPSTASGEWFVSYTAIACSSNVWKDDSCTVYNDGYSGVVEPPTLTVTLPQSEPLMFTWK
jgi:hypothetical protein